MNMYSNKIAKIFNSKAKKKELFMPRNFQMMVEMVDTVKRDKLHIINFVCNAGI